MALAYVRWSLMAAASRAALCCVPAFPGLAIALRFLAPSAAFLPAVLTGTSPSAPLRAPVFFLGGFPARDFGGSICPGRSASAQHV
jgi:hypothetical protein